MISDFDETFRVCREFNSEHFYKKRVLNSLCFGGDRLEILRALKTQKMSFSAIFGFLLIRHI
jgi:hypothetical protein